MKKGLFIIILVPLVLLFVIVLLLYLPITKSSKDEYAPPNYTLDSYLMGEITETMTEPCDLRFEYLKTQELKNSQFLSCTKNSDCLSSSSGICLNKIGYYRYEGLKKFCSENSPSELRMNCKCEANLCLSK